MLAAAIPKHREDGADGFLEHFLLGFHVAAERRQFGDRRAFAHSEFATSIAEKIEHRDTFGDARGMIGGELEDAVAEPDVPGALAGGGEKRFRRRRMRIFFEKMMLHHPGVVVTAAVRGLQLRQRVLVELEFISGLPWARQLQLIEDAEFHDVSPRYRLVSRDRLVVAGIVIAGGAESTIKQIPCCGRETLSCGPASPVTSGGEVKCDR